MNLSIIIVSYNTREMLKECIESIISSIKNLSYEIIVADNNSSDGSQSMILEKFPQINLLINNKNIGFSRANNEAFKKSKGEKILFLNSDTLILGDAIEKMIAYMNSSLEIGVIGPKILNAKYQPTRSYMRYLDIKKILLGSERFKAFIDVRKNRIHFSDYDFNTIREVEWMSGACMMVRREVFQTALLFDESYFMYFEDMDFCLQVEKLFYKKIYFPEAEIIHFFGASSSENKKIELMHKDSMKHYFKKNFPVHHYWLVRLYLLFLGKHFE